MSSPLLRLAVRLMAVPLVLLGLWLVWRGHNLPGGGFIGALLIGIALALRELTALPDTVSRIPAASVLLGIGLVLAAGITILPLFFGQALLTSSDVHLHPPLLGDLHLTTSLVFDAGVAFIVVGLVRGIIDALGGDPEPEATATPSAPHVPDGSDTEVRR